MAFGTCTICTANEAKYKCPKCAIVYCSLPCFKDPKHVHEAPEPTTLPTSPKVLEEAPEEDSKFALIAQDPVIKTLLAQKALRVHLAVLLKLLNDSLLTREPILENRKEIVNMRLCNLRMGGGPEENELVEEFVQRVMELVT